MLSHTRARALARSAARFCSVWALLNSLSNSVLMFCRYNPERSYDCTYHQERSYVCTYHPKRLPLRISHGATKTYVYTRPLAPIHDPFNNSDGDLKGKSGQCVGFFLGRVFIFAEGSAFTFSTPQDTISRCPLTPALIASHTKVNGK